MRLPPPWRLQYHPTQWPCPPIPTATFRYTLPRQLYQSTATATIEFQHEHPSIRDLHRSSRYDASLSCVIHRTRHQWLNHCTWSFRCPHGSVVAVPLLALSVSHSVSHCIGFRSDEVSSVCGIFNLSHNFLIRTILILDELLESYILKQLIWPRGVFCSIMASISATVSTS